MCSQWNILNASDEWPLVYAGDYNATHEKSPLKPLMHIMLVYMGTMENPRELNGFNIKLRVQVSKKY